MNGGKNMMDRIYETTIKGFGLNIWIYATNDEWLSGLIEEWQSSDDPIETIDQATNNNDLICVPFFNSDAVFMYFDKDTIKFRHYKNKEMREIIRDTFMSVLWLTYKDNRHSGLLTEVEFKKKCMNAMTLESLGDELSEHIQELI